MTVARRPPITTFTAVLSYPGEPARFFRAELTRSKRPPAMLELPSFVDPSGRLDTFILVSSLSWPTVAIYTLSDAAAMSSDPPAGP
ncbi:MAG: hypothetical protein JWQ19_2837 [Subtercola sp.]|nr:hypothetical protein [Subtercola sp.]